MIAKILGWVRDKKEETILMRYALTVYVFASMGTVCPVVIADDPLVVELWPNQVPNKAGNNRLTGSGSCSKALAPSWSKRFIQAATVSGVTKNAWAVCLRDHLQTARSSRICILSTGA